MGWKSTIEITRDNALSLIMSQIHCASDDELSSTLESLGFGENEELEYYGHNFMVNSDSNE